VEGNVDDYSGDTRPMDTAARINILCAPVDYRSAGPIPGNVVGESLACSVVDKRFGSVCQTVSAPGVPCLPGFHRCKLSSLTVGIT
jgi:hypothetical protein